MLRRCIFGNEAPAISPPLAPLPTHLQRISTKTVVDKPLCLLIVVQVHGQARVVLRPRPHGPAGSMGHLVQMWTGKMSVTVCYRPG